MSFYCLLDISHKIYSEIIDTYLFLCMPSSYKSESTIQLGKVYSYIRVPTKLIFYTN